MAEIRPLAQAAALGRAYPGAWREVDGLRAQRGRALPDWPSWCFLPLAGASAIVSRGQDLAPDDQSLDDIAPLSALAAWRTTQLVYRFDPDLLEALTDDDLPERLPSDVLRRLPTWCPYVTWPTPLHLDDGPPLHGYYVFLEYDAHERRPELRWVLDSQSSLFSCILYLDQATIGEAIAAPLAVAQEGAALRGERLDVNAMTAAYRQMLALLLPTTLYLCADNADVTPGALAPRFPAPKRTKGEIRFFPPAEVQQWDVGVRIGAALRGAHQTGNVSRSDEGGAHARPRAHVRKAHWHHYWTGPRSGDRALILHWLPPVPVNLEPNARLPVTVRPVRRDDERRGD